jgi:hypothetical protein
MEEVSIIPSGYFGDSSNNIVVFENFIDPDDLSLVQAFLPTIDEWDNGKDTEYDENGVCIYDAAYWNDRMCSGGIIGRKNPVVYQTIEKYIEKMAGKVQEFFNVKVSSRNPVLMRWFEGIEQQPHADKELNCGSPNPFPTYDLNSLIYYNDDFTGGELYFPDHDIEITPKPGLAVMFVGDRNYLHGVRTVTSGERWTTPSFYTVVENYNEGAW